MFFGLVCIIWWQAPSIPHTTGLLLSFCTISNWLGQPSVSSNSGSAETICTCLDSEGPPSGRELLAMVSCPKTIRTHCKKCKIHQEHKVRPHVRQQLPIAAAAAAAAAALAIVDGVRPHRAGEPVQKGGGQPGGAGKAALRPQDAGLRRPEEAHLPQEGQGPHRRKRPNTEPLFRDKACSAPGHPGPAPWAT